MVKYPMDMVMTGNCTQGYVGPVNVHDNIASGFGFYCAAIQSNNILANVLVSPPQNVTGLPHKPYVCNNPFTKF
jgi:hypothetical protein